MPRHCPRSSPVGGGRLGASKLHVQFPDYWDGRRLDSADQQSNTGYARDGRGPTSHSARLPSLDFIVSYPIRNGRAVAQAWGRELNAHADFFKACDQRELERIVEFSVRRRARCSR